MITTTQREIGRHVQLALPYERAIERATAALKTEGFGVLTQIDVQATFKNKLGVEFPRYIILGACNPAFAHRSLTADPDVGLLLPCNVTVRELAPGECVVSIVDPLSMLGVIESDALKPIAAEVRASLERVADALEKG